MQNTELKNTLMNSRFYQALDPQELDSLANHTNQVTYSPGSTIIKQGTKSEGVYILLEGEVNIAGQIVGEGRVNLATLNPGSIFGGTSVILRGPNATSVIAKTAVRCLLITTNYFEMLSLFYPVIKYKIMREIAETICNRILIMSEKIIARMISSDMATRSIFGEVAKTLTRPSPISYEEAGIDINQLKKMNPISIFNGELNEFINKAVLIKAAKQCPLLQEGEKNIASYLVLRGAVQSSIVKQNKVAKISILGPMSLFCPLSIINNNLPSGINYTTCERSILLKIEQSSLNELQLENANTWYKLFDLICESLLLLGKFTEKLEIRINSEIYNR